MTTTITHESRSELIANLRAMADDMASDLDWCAQAADALTADAAAIASLGEDYAAATHLLAMRDAEVAAQAGRIAELEKALRTIAEPAETVRWLQDCLRDYGACPDGGKCHHGCKPEHECARKTQFGCVPLLGSGLTDDWALPTNPKDSSHE